MILKRSRTRRGLGAGGRLQGRKTYFPDSPPEWTFEFDPEQETFQIKVDKAVVTPKKATIFSKMKKRKRQHKKKTTI